MYLPKEHPVHSFKLHVSLSWRTADKAGAFPRQGPVGLLLEFHLPGKVAGWHTCVPDADNLAKSVKDALRGLAWEDDRQVCILRVLKVCVIKDPRTVITLFEPEKISEVNEYERHFASGINRPT